MSERSKEVAAIAVALETRCWECRASVGSLCSVPAGSSWLVHPEHILRARRKRGMKLIDCTGIAA